MTLSQQELEALISKAVALYNRVRSPEITAKAILVVPERVTVSFSGGFCYGCGIMDYVESFTQQFKALTAKAELKIDKTREITPRTFEADFVVKNK